MLSLVESSAVGRSISARSGQRLDLSVEFAGQGLGNLAAAFFGGYDFGEYQSHSLYISRYPYGREATLSFPHPDLQIVNNSPHGVLVWPTHDETSITVDLYSTTWAVGEQTDQRQTRYGPGCTRVDTERTRAFVDGRSVVDSVVAHYRPREGVRC